MYYLPRYIRYTSLQVSKLSYVVGSIYSTMRFRSPTPASSRSSSKLMRKCLIDNWISSFALRHYSTEAFLLHQECTTVFTMIVGGIPKDLVKQKYGLKLQKPIRT